MIAPPGGDEKESLARMDEWMRQLSNNGGNYIRVWLSSPFWDVEHERAGVYDRSRARRIDQMLAMARALKSGQPLKHSYDHELLLHETVDGQQLDALIAGSGVRVATVVAGRSLQPEEALLHHVRVLMLAGILVLAADSRIVFGGLYYVLGQVGQSWTGTDITKSSPIWTAEFDRTARHWGFNYKLNGIGNSFTTRSGASKVANVSQSRAAKAWVNARVSVVRREEAASMAALAKCAAGGSAASSS